MVCVTHLFGHIVPVLRGVNARFERRSPRCGIYGGPLVLRTCEGLPVDEESNGVLCLGDAVERLTRGNAGRSTSNDTRGDGPILHHPAVDVDVVRRQIVADGVVIL